ncbi:hypothetical protein LI328DRAFT_164634 [Trichoderma asperelloides]|nr:hypothetical protein LI328DRAFT_164634 [Trichoderma asperelloides]
MGELDKMDSMVRYKGRVSVCPRDGAPVYQLLYQLQSILSGAQANRNLAAFPVPCGKVRKARIEKRSEGCAAEMVAFSFHGHAAPCSNYMRRMPNLCTGLRWHQLKSRTKNKRIANLHLFVFLATRTVRHAISTPLGQVGRHRPVSLTVRRCQFQLLRLNTPGQPCL